MEGIELTNNLGLGGEIFSFNLLSLLKIPIVLALVVVILFSVLLFLRIRILADTFKTPQNKIIKKAMILHIAIVILGTLLSLLFIIIA